MFGISFEELLVLMVLALILFGPDKLPEYAAKLGRLVSKLRQASSEVTQEIQSSYLYEPPRSAREKPQESFCHSAASLWSPPSLFAPNAAAA